VTTRRRFPKEGKAIKTSKGEERVISNDLFRELVTLRAEEGESRTIPLAELRAELDGLGIPFPAPGGPPPKAVVVLEPDHEVVHEEEDEETFELVAASDPDIETTDALSPPPVSGSEPTLNRGPKDRDSATHQPTNPLADGEPRRGRRRGRRGGRRGRGGPDNSGGQQNPPSTPNT
jgi:hypothetical protein